MQRNILLLFFILKNIFISSVSGGRVLEYLTDPGRYNATEMPKYFSKEGTIAPVKVIVGMVVRNIEMSIENPNWYSVRIELKVKMSWYDSRLKYESIRDTQYIYTSNEKQIWIPPVMLVIHRDASDQYPYVYYRIFPNSLVQSGITTHLEIKQYFNEDFANGISIRLVSLKYAEDNLTLEWDQENPLEVSDDVDRSPRIFSMGRDDFEARPCYMTIEPLPREPTGKYSCLELMVNVNKEFRKQFAIFTVYIPGIFAVVISWACFWMEGNAVLGSAMVFVICLGHLMIQKSTVVKNVSVLENHGALNVWFDACLGFVFATFFVKIGVTAIYVKSSKELTRRSSNESLSVATTVQEGEEECIVERRDGDTNTLCNHFPRIWLNRFPSTADAINAICRVLFPLCFVIFLCVFFTSVH